VQVEATHRLTIRSGTFIGAASVAHMPSPRTLLVPDEVVLPDRIARGFCVLVEGGRVVAVLPDGADGTRAGSCERRELRGCLLPGLVDLQVNGHGGVPVEDESAGAFDALARSVASCGTAAFLPTLVSAPFDLLRQRVRHLARQVREHARRPASAASALPLGIHLEGPFLEIAGAHDADALCDPTPERVDALLEDAAGTLALVTLAPGRSGAADAVRRFVAAGTTVALGHAGPQSDDDAVAACIDAGATLVTHLFNVMPPLHHRAPGLVGRALDDPSVSASLIADGAHLDARVLRLAFRSLGPTRTILVSDSIAAAGCGDDEAASAFDLGDRRVHVVDGVARDDEGRLAGSASTLATCAERFAATCASLGVGSWTLARVVSTNPARLLGERGESLGAVVPGARAVFTLRPSDGSPWRTVDAAAR
jgi:N-acetylglucosamine-6-phosphate deacetylase